MNGMLAFCADYLVNCLWQAPLLCATAWLLAPWMRRLGPAWEHRLWVATLAAQAVLPACAFPGLQTTLAECWSSLAALVARTFGHTTAAGHVTVSMVMVQASPHASVAGRLLWLALATYALVTLALTLRLLMQVRTVAALRRSAAEEALGDLSTASLQDALLQFGVRRPVCLATSTAAATPLTFGLWQPMVLLPRGFAERVTPRQLRAALSHEAAHVARNDATKHLLYRILTIPIAFHPATWLTLTRVVSTREQACDRMAATLAGGPRTYARSLLELSSILASTRFACPNAVGIADGQPLERRIVMLQRPLFPVSRMRRSLSLVCTGVVCLSACTSALALHRDVGSTLAATSSTKNGKVVRVSTEVMAGQVISKVAPVYPPEAKKAHISGVVLLKAIIGKDGSIANLQVISGPTELQSSAMDAVRQWKYKPYLLNGEPTEVETTITIHYSFEGEEQPGSAPAVPPAAASLDTIQPKLVSQADPVYPEAARKAKASGDVQVAMLVNTDGSVSEVAALSGPEVFRQSAIDAVRQYRFTPAMRNGQATPVEMRVEVKFQTF